MHFVYQKDRAVCVYVVQCVVWIADDFFALQLEI